MKMEISSVSMWKLVRFMWVLGRVREGRGEGHYRGEEKGGTKDEGRMREG
jgi:hypothetical protein